MKEPHYFNTDDQQCVATLGDYELLFVDATDQHIAVGEASVWYLSSTEAVRNILRYQPEARFIVMVRNPVEMAPALPAEMLLSGHESFATSGQPGICKRNVARADGCRRSAERGGVSFMARYAHSAPNSSGCSRAFPQAVFLLLCLTTCLMIRGRILASTAVPKRK